MAANAAPVPADRITGVPDAAIFGNGQKNLNRVGSRFYSGQDGSAQMTRRAVTNVRSQTLPLNVEIVTPIPLRYV